MATPWTLVTSNVCGKRAMPDDDQIEVLRSVLAHAYEKRRAQRIDQKAATIRIEHSFSAQSLAQISNEPRHSGPTVIHAE
jgi:hypothetical protein